MKYDEIFKEHGHALWRVYRNLAWESWKEATKFDSSTPDQQIDIENQFCMWWGSYSVNKE